MKDLKQVDRRVAIVFGGGRGIGAAIARRLADDGFAVALTFISDPGSADGVVRTIEAAGGEAIALAADSGDASALASVVARTVERFGGLDAAVISAGVYLAGGIEKFSLSDLDRTLHVNVRGVFLALQAVTASLREGGRIITIGSCAADRPAGGSAAYAMSKAAVAALVKSAALELAARRITVNNIQPGPISTNVTQSLADQLRERLPVGRIGSPSEVATLTSYLAGPGSSYMTGASLTIDGGFSL